MKKEKNLLRILFYDSGVPARDVYELMYPGEEYAKQRLYNALEPGRAPSPWNWKAFRLGIGMSRKEFWQKAMDFFDPEK